MADPRPVQSKLSTSPGPHLRASRGSLELHSSTEWVAWSEPFLFSLPTFLRLETAVRERFASSKVGFQGENVREALLQALRQATTGETAQGVTFYGQAFKDYLNGLFQAVGTGLIEFTLCRRLIGVDMSQDVVELSESVRLVRLSDEELTARMPPFELIRLGLVTPDLGPLNRVEVRVRRQEAFTDFSMLRTGPSRPRVLLRESERVQEALLLMGAEGQVELGSYVWLTSDPPLGSCAPPPLSYTGGGVIFPPMMLHSGDIPQLLTCFDVANQVQVYPPLKSALHRYAIACSRARSEDSLVDLVIGFESILLQGLQNELSHRFSLNGSSLCYWILKQPRRESYHLFRSAYAARSSVVHGYGRKLKAARLESLSNELRHLLATFLIWLIRDASNFGLRPRLESEDWLRLLFESPPAPQGGG